MVATKLSGFVHCASGFSGDIMDVCHGCHGRHSHLPSFSTDVHGYGIQCFLQLSRLDRNACNFAADQGPKRGWAVGYAQHTLATLVLEVCDNVFMRLEDKVEVFLRSGSASSAHGFKSCGRLLILCSLCSIQIWRTCSRSSSFR